MNIIGYSVQGEASLQIRPYSDLNLYAAGGARKYLNASERQRFEHEANLAPPEVRLFCLTLYFTGGRISEVLALTPAAIDLDEATANLTTLKRRRRGFVRQVPLPLELITDLNSVFQLRARQRNLEASSVRIWRWSRTTAWTRVKEIMARADIVGLAACPKGLRHAFGVNAFQKYVPPHLVQRWLGHASLRTTSIYADVVGDDERAFARRMWQPSLRRQRRTTNAQ